MEISTPIKPYVSSKLIRFDSYFPSSSFASPLMMSADHPQMMFIHVLCANRLLAGRLYHGLSTKYGESYWNLEQCLYKSPKKWIWESFWRCSNNLTHTQTQEPQT